MKRIAIIGIIITGLSGCSSKSYIETSAGLSESTIDLPLAARGRLTLALKYIEIENFQQAKINLDKAIDYLPDNAETYLAYAYYYQKVQEYKSAELAYQHALQLAPENGNIHNNYGAFLCGQQRYTDAEAEFLAAIASSGYNQIANSYENAGQCALAQGGLPLALKYLQSSLAHNPQYLAVRFSIAELNYKLGDYITAKQQLTKYETAEKVTARALWLGFNIANKQGDSAVAEVYSRKLLTQFPLAIQTQKYITNDY